MPGSHRIRWLLWYAPLALLLLVSGCGKDEELPQTYAVKGKVVTKDGKPYRDGAGIMFRPVDNHELQAYGAIAPDGTFVLHTLGRTKTGRSKKLGGSVEGECKVNIEPVAAKGMPFWLTKSYRIEPNENNEIVVELEK